MAISVRTRFEIFKRDEFTCRYCGKTSPEVILEVDHIVPVAEGGTDDPMNLATSCWACNSGKGCVPLNQIITGADPHDRAIELIERERQLREYNRVTEDIRMQREADAFNISTYWRDNAGTEMTDREYSWLLNTLARTPVSKVIEAMDIAIVKGKTRDLRYVGGILRSWRHEESDADPPLD